MNKYFAEGVRKIKKYDRSELNKAIESGEILEAKAMVAKADNQLVVKLGTGIVGVIPEDEFEYNRTGREINRGAIISRVGHAVQFVVKGKQDKKDEYGCTVYNLSRKEAQERCYSEYVDKLEAGQVIDAYVNRAEDFGIFCDIGAGVIGMIPAYCMCMSRISDMSKVFSDIGNVKVVLRKIEDGKITLSMRELLGTWQEEMERFSIGETVIGTVRSVTEYGLFVELTPNLVGLTDLNDKCAGAKVGDLVVVHIKNYDPKRMRVKLFVVEVLSEETGGQVQLRYRIPESGRVDEWVYSPSGCKKLIRVEYMQKSTE